MATYSSIFAWRIPQTEKPVGLQTTWSQSQIQQKQLSMQAQAKSSQRDIVDLASLNLKKFSAKT